MRFIYFNTWSQVGRTGWEGLGGLAFLEEMGGGGFEVSKAQVSSLLHAYESRCKLQATAPLPIPTCLLPCFLP